jgi:hypothetical protein
MTLLWLVCPSMHDTMKITISNKLKVFPLWSENERNITSLKQIYAMSDFYIATCHSQIPVLSDELSPAPCSTKSVKKFVVSETSKKIGDKHIDEHDCNLELVELQKAWYTA